MESLPLFHLHCTKRLKMLNRLLASKSTSFNEKKARYLIGKLFPHHVSRVMKFLGQLVAFMLVVVSFPRLGPMFDSFLLTVHDEYSFDPDKFKVLPMLYRELTNEGLLRGGARALFLSNEVNHEGMYESSMILFDNEMDHISIADLEQQNSIPNNTFDFAFTFEYHDAAVQFIDHALRVGGIVAIQLGGENPNNSDSFQIPSNYKIAYIRRFDSPILVLKKIGEVVTESTHMRRRLCGLASQKKKEALKNLEDVLLEPPRAATGRSSRYIKKTRYLPNLMGDNLEGYRRRVFMDVAPVTDGWTGTKWFIENYPTKNLQFDMYKMEIVATEEDQYPSSSPSSSADQHESLLPRIGMSEWLRKNVKEEDYVVMKADVEVVEEMMNHRATGLIDELFLECKPKGKKNNKMKGSDANGSNKRAYWECLSLYGRLRDEGVAVHQWWL